MLGLYGLDNPPSAVTFSKRALFVCENVKKCLHFLLIVVYYSVTAWCLTSDYLMGNLDLKYCNIWN